MKYEELIGFYERMKTAGSSPMYISTELIGKLLAVAGAALVTKRDPYDGMSVEEWDLHEALEALK